VIDLDDAQRSNSPQRSSHGCKSIPRGFLAPPQCKYRGWGSCIDPALHGATARRFDTEDPTLPVDFDHQCTHARLLTGKVELLDAGSHERLAFSAQ